jgi:hypothetical protein
MRRTALALLSGLAILAPALALATGDAVAIDAKILANAKVERNGKHVGTVQRVMVNPTTGRIEHLDVVMTEGQQRNIAVPWSGVKIFQDNGGHMTVSLTSRVAGEVSPSASPSMSVPAPRPANNVAAAQQWLKEHGYYSGPVDGVLGPGTSAALRAYQRDRRLDATGQLDASTARALANETAAIPTPVPDVRTAQRQLKERGYYSGPVDGVMGPATESALRAFQRDRGLKATGRLDPVTMRTLSA